VAIRADRHQRLWILSKRVRSDWRSFVVEVVRPNGRLGLEPRPDAEFTPDSLFTSLLEIVDLESRSIVASAELASLMHGFVADDLLFQNTLTTAGMPRIAVWQISETFP
jgi:hypothetical protein